MYALSQLGLILLLFNVGMEFDFARLSTSRLRHATHVIAIASLVLPFGLGLIAGYLAAPSLCPGADRLFSALFVATALSITALPILGRILIEFGINREPLGVVAISAAAINDVAGWLMLAALSTLAISQFNGSLFLMRVAGIAVAGLVSWFVVRPLLKRLVAAWLEPRAHADAVPKVPDRLLTALIVVILLGAICSSRLGIFPIFGAFLMGTLLHDETALRHAWNERIGHFVGVFFVPIFFTYTGLRCNIGGLNEPTLWAWCAVFVGVATLGKFGAAYLAARFCGWSHPRATAVGILMNTRALMELIVLNVGLDLGMVSRNVFTMLVIMALISTLATSPVLRRCLQSQQRP
jgi:Kef-type K+ transport system membrane component KefB